MLARMNKTTYLDVHDGLLLALGVVNAHETRPVALERLLLLQELLGDLIHELMRGGVFVCISISIFPKGV